MIRDYKNLVPFATSPNSR